MRRKNGQGLKPLALSDLIGTAEAVPFHKAFYAVCS